MFLVLKKAFGRCVPQRLGPQTLLLFITLSEREEQDSTGMGSGLGRFAGIWQKAVVEVW